MGQVVNSLAFPVPMLPHSFYEKELCERRDFITLSTNEGESIPACFVQPHRAASQQQDFLAGPPRKVLLYSHGNAEDLALQMEFVDDLARETNTDIFCYEYVGYSLSRFDGKEPSEAGCLRSIDAAWRYCTETLAIPPGRIVLYGRSIGTGPTVDLASRASVTSCSHSPQDVGGVVLQSPLESGARAVFGHWTSLAGYFLDIFKNYEKVDKIAAPVGIIHGIEDEVVPCDNGRALHQLLVQKRSFEPDWVAGAGHNDIPQERCLQYLKNFLDFLDKSENLTD